jgi:hypothetical protein
MPWTDTPDTGLSYAYPRPLYPFAPPQTVSTETPLLTLVELGLKHIDVTVTLRNHDAVNQAAFYVDRSESGAVVDADRQTVYVPPLKERRLEFRDVLSLFWALSAAGDPDTGNPSVQVSWQIVTRRRR